MSELGGYDPNKSMLPQASGHIMAMNGGGGESIMPPAGYNPHTSMIALPPTAAGAVIEPVKGGASSDAVIISMGNEVLGNEVVGGESVDINTPSTGIINITPGMHSKAIGENIKTSDTSLKTPKEFKLGEPREITLFGKVILLDDPTELKEDQKFTVEQIKALAEFGLDGPSLEWADKKRILKALYKGGCNTDIPLSSNAGCEPIREIIQKLAINLLDKMAADKKKIEGVAEVSMKKEGDKVTICVVIPEDKRNILATLPLNAPTEMPSAEARDNGSNNGSSSQTNIDANNIKKVANKKGIDPKEPVDIYLFPSVPTHEIVVPNSNQIKNEPITAKMEKETIESQLGDKPGQYTSAVDFKVGDVIKNDDNRGLVRAIISADKDDSVVKTSDVITEIDNISTTIANNKESYIFKSMIVNEYINNILLHTDVKRELEILYPGKTLTVDDYIEGIKAPMIPGNTESGAALEIDPRIAAYAYSRKHNINVRIYLKSTYRGAINAEKTNFKVLSENYYKNFYDSAVDKATTYDRTIHILISVLGDDIQYSVLKPSINSTDIEVIPEEGPTAEKEEPIVEEIKGVNDELKPNRVVSPPISLNVSNTDTKLLKDSVTSLTITGDGWCLYRALYRGYKIIVEGKSKTNVFPNNVNGSYKKNETLELVDLVKQITTYIKSNLFKMNIFDNQTFEQYINEQINAGNPDFSLGYSKEGGQNIPIKNADEYVAKLSELRDSENPALGPVVWGDSQISGAAFSLIKNVYIHVYNELPFFTRALRYKNGTLSEKERDNLLIDLYKESAEFKDKAANINITSKNGQTKITNILNQYLEEIKQDTTKLNDILSIKAVEDLEKKKNIDKYYHLLYNSTYLFKDRNIKPSEKPINILFVNNNHYELLLQKSNNMNFKGDIGAPIELGDGDIDYLAPMSTIVEEGLEAKPVAPVEEPMVEKVPVAEEVPVAPVKEPVAPVEEPVVEEVPVAPVEAPVVEEERVMENTRAATTEEGANTGKIQINGRNTRAINKEIRNLTQKLKKQGYTVNKSGRKIPIGRPQKTAKVPKENSRKRMNTLTAKATAEQQGMPGNPMTAKNWTKLYEAQEETAKRYQLPTTKKGGKRVTFKLDKKERRKSIKPTRN